MNTKVGLSLRELLLLEPFRNTKVVGGEGGLEKIVANVNVMEVPDIHEWVRPGELLLTTAYAIRDNVDAQQTLVAELAQKGLVGLAIKPRRYIERIPDIMIEQANRYDFPLLELPLEISFSDLIAPALTAILDKQNNYLNQSLQAHRLFMDIILSGGNLEDMAASLAQAVENTVVIHDTKHGRISWKAVNWDEQRIEDLWDKMNFQGPFAYGEMNKTPVAINGRKIVKLEVPIYSGNENYGRVMVWETNRPISYSDILIVERLATVAALEIVNKHALIQVERRYANEFLDLLLFSKVEAENDLIRRGKFFGWDLAKPYVAVILQYEIGLVEADSENEKKRQETTSRIHQAVHDFYLRRNTAAITGTKNDMVVLLLEIKKREPKLLRKAILGEIKALRKALAPLLQDNRLTICIGRYYEGIAGIQKSYREAQKAVRLVKKTNRQGGDVYFDDLGIYRLLSLIEKKEELEEYLEETIAPLLKYDQEKNTELVKTLEMFFRYQGNTRKVSQELYTHYNTILYRIERIGKITGLDLNNPEDRFNLEVALRVSKLIYS